MKLAALATLVGCAVAAPLTRSGSLSQQEYAAKWGAYKLDYGKNHTAADEPRRFALFQANIDMIERENALGTNTYTLGLTEYTDWSHVEFVHAKLSGAMRTGARNYNYNLLSYNGTKAESVDWRAKGAVTPVKNQGECGGCWAFSAIGAMEGLSKIADGKLLELSEQQLIDCSKNGHNAGCNGGIVDAAFKYAEKEGMCTEKAYKFDGKNGKCKQCKKVFKISGYEDVPKNDEKALEAAVQKNPVSVAIESDRPAFQHYKSGVLSGKACGTSLDHAVLTVGFGEDNNQKYWIVKNSWGANWGEKGYVRILKDGKSKEGECGIAIEPSYPTK